MYTLDLETPNAPLQSIALTMGRLLLGTKQGLPEGAPELELRSGLVVLNVRSQACQMGSEALAPNTRRVLRADESVQLGAHRLTLRACIEPPAGTRVLAREALKAQPSRLETGCPSLLWLNGPELGKRVRLDVEATFLGRGEGCSARVSDARASRTHAKIVRGTHGFQLIDLMSANGLLVDGKKLEGSCELKGGETLAIGSTLIGFEWRRPSAPVAPPVLSAAASPTNSASPNANPSANSSTSANNAANANAKAVEDKAVAPSSPTATETAIPRAKKVPRASRFEVMLFGLSLGAVAATSAAAWWALH
jgi:pSer/pThr/pTyr-binding forkhead associated (FHA) protein